LKLTPDMALIVVTLLSTALRPAAAARGGTSQWIPQSAQATTTTSKFRGTLVRAPEKNHIQRSGSVRTETRRCIKRTGTRPAALLPELDRGIMTRWGLRTWEIRLQGATKRQRRQLGSMAASLFIGNTIQSSILAAVGAGTPIDCAGPRQL